MSAPYKKLFTFCYSVLIYDYTVQFCALFIKSWKLKEQMEGAARSGKQNIVEGSDAMKTSLKSAIKLTNVAKASLEELTADYEDFLRQRNLQQWNKEDPRVLLFRGKAVKLVRAAAAAAAAPASQAPVSNLSNLRAAAEPPHAAGRSQRLVSHLKEPQEAANLLLTLCHQATYLLNKQVEALERKHAREGGYTEKLYQARKHHRGY